MGSLRTRPVADVPRAGCVPQRLLASRSRLACLGPGLLALAIYVATLAATVTGEDSGELITAAWHFGVPHPPGYPLWTMLCGAWLHVLPVGSVAWRANLFSAIGSAAGVSFLAAALQAMGFRARSAAVAALLCGLTTAIWSQSVIAEVYALNWLISAAALWVIARWDRDRTPRWLLLASLLVGLGMSNHHIIGFWALGLALWVITRQPALLRDWRLGATCIVVMALGLLPYGYLLWAAGRAAPVNWGETTTLAALWEHVSRGQYVSDHPIEAPIERTAALLAARFFYGVRWESGQFTPGLLPLLVAGTIWLARRRRFRPWLLCTALIVLSSGPLYLVIGGPRMDRQDEFVQKVFLTPLALASAIPLAAGLHWLSAALRSARHFLSPMAARRLSGLVVCSLIVVPLWAHGRENAMRHYWLAHDHATNILACLRPGAIIFPSGDHNTFPLIYLQAVEGQRRDVILADKYGYIEPTLYAAMPDNPGKPRTPEERDRIEEWIIRHSRRPVYYTVKKPPLVENADMVAVGLVYHLLPHGQEIDATSCWSAIRYRNLEGLLAPPDNAAANILADHQYALASRALAAGDREAALQHFARAAELAWGLKEILNNIGSALAEAGMIDEAIGYYEQAARLDWRYAPARWNLARLFKSLGRMAWAAQVYEDLTRATPGDFRPFGELGFLYRDELGDVEQAQAWWFESLRIHPRQEQIIAALAELDRGPSGDARPVESDGPDGPTKPDATASPPTEPGTDDSPALMRATPTQGLSLNPGEVDFGKIVQGERPLRHVLIENTTEAPRTLRGLEASCGCLQVEADVQGLAPGDCGELTITLHHAERLGPLHETVTVQTDDPQQPLLTFPVKGEIVAVLACEPPALRLELLAGEPVPPTTLRVVHNGGQSFQIRSVSTTLSGLFMQWNAAAEAMAHTIVVRSNGATSDSQETITIVTSLAERPTLEVALSISNLPPAKPRPALLFVGRVGPETAVERTIVLSPIRVGLKLTPAVSEPPPDGWTVVLEPDAALPGQWRARVSIDSRRAAPGPFTYVLRFTFAGCARPLEVPVHGSVADQNETVERPRPVWDLSEIHTK